MSDETTVPDATAGQVDALGLGRGLRIAARVLAVPAAIVASLAAIGLLAVAAVLATALGGPRPVIAAVLLALALAGLGAALWFGARIRATLRAAGDPEVLATELVRLLDVSAVLTAIRDDLSELTSRAGGVRAISRARALLRVMRRLDVEEHVGAFEHAQWFVPPRIAATWVIAQVAFWAGVLGWAALPILVGVRLGSWL